MKWIYSNNQDFRFYYFWLCFVHENFQNAYFRICLFTTNNYLFQMISSPNTGFYQAIIVVNKYLFVIRYS